MNKATKLTRNDIVEVLANYHLDAMNLKDWSFKINKRMSDTLGQCDWNNKVIEISKKHIEDDSFAEIIESIVHEVAHAITSPDEPWHGKVWQNNKVKIQMRT